MFMTMKKLFAVLMLLLPFVALQTEAARKKTTVWENPVKMYANTGTIEVTRVELADTATVLYLHAESHAQKLDKNSQREPAKRHGRQDISADVG